MRVVRHWSRLPRGCPIIGSIQGQVGWGSEQPDLVKDVPAQDRRVGLNDL